MALGAHHTVVWNERSTLVCGQNCFYQLGLDDSVDRATLTPVSLADIAQGSCSETYTCFLTRGGVLYFQGTMGDMCRI